MFFLIVTSLCAVALVIPGCGGTDSRWHAGAALFDGSGEPHRLNIEVTNYGTYDGDCGGLIRPHPGGERFELDVVLAAGEVGSGNYPLTPSAAASAPTAWATRSRWTSSCDAIKGSEFALSGSLTITQVSNSRVSGRFVAQFDDGPMDVAFEVPTCPISALPVDWSCPSYTLPVCSPHCAADEVCTQTWPGVMVPSPPPTACSPMPHACNSKPNCDCIVSSFCGGAGAVADCGYKDGEWVEECSYP